MKRLILALCVLCLPLTVLAESGTHQEEVKAAEKVLEAAYRAYDTNNYCRTYTLGTFFITIGEIQVAVDCKLRNQWVSLYAKK